MRRREFITFLGGAAGTSPTSIDVRYFAAFGALAGTERNSWSLCTRKRTNYAHLSFVGHDPERTSLCNILTRLLQSVSER